MDLSPELSPSPTADDIFGSLHTVCFIVGVIGNAVLLSYFTTRIKHDLPTILYMCCCANDIITSTLGLFVAICFFHHREPGLFGNPAFCKCWALLSRINQRVTVFIIMVLTISRTVRLVFPLRQVRRRFALVSVCIWVGLAILYEVVLTSK